MRTRLLTTATLIAVLVPMAASAQYLSPEDVLLRDQSALSVPKNRREARQAAEEQQQQNTEKERPTVTEWWTTSSAPSSAAAVAPTDSEEDPTLHPSAPEEPGLENLDPITLRFLRRLQQQNAGTTMHSTALHSGADLSGTGPAETMTVMLVMAAIGWTIWRSRGMRQLVAR